LFRVGPASVSSHDVGVCSKGRRPAPWGSTAVGHPSCAVAARLVLRRAPSRPFAVASRVLKVFLPRAAPCCSIEQRSALHAFRLVHRAPDSARASHLVLAFASPRVCRLSWGWCVALPSTCRVCVHSGRRCRRLRPAGCQRLRVSVRPRRFSRPRRLAPHTRRTPPTRVPAPDGVSLECLVPVGAPRRSGCLVPSSPASWSVGPRPGVSGCGLVASRCRTGSAAFQLAGTSFRRRGLLARRHLLGTSPSVCRPATRVTASSRQHPP